MSDGNPSRRQALQIIVVIGGAAAMPILPMRWAKPVVQSIIVPAHAQASPGLTTTTITAPTLTPLVSDVRLGRLDNGLARYGFRYLSNRDLYVGVIAQEVLSVVPKAVIVGEDGYMRVDYAQLGTRIMTWAEWQRNGSENRRRQRRPAASD
jgi:hypothetical protein